MRFIFLFSFFLIFSCSSTSPSYNKIIKNETDRSTRKKLKVFFDEGVGKRLQTNGATANTLVKAAKKYLGMPHCFGGDVTKGCTDCSGLLFRAFNDAGAKVRVRGSEAMARYGKVVYKRNELQKGDLVFFVRTYKTKRVITHSGIMVDSKNMIHVSTRKGVQIVPVFDNGYWENRFVFGTRMF